MQTQGNGAMQKRQSLDLINIRRNPYLVDYEEQKRLRRMSGAKNGRSHRSGSERARRSVEMIEIGVRRPSGAGNTGNERTLDLIEIGRGGQRPKRQEAGRRYQAAGTVPGGQSRSVSGGRQRNPAAAKKRRRKRALYRKIAAVAWILCIFMIGWLILLKKGNASGLEQNDSLKDVQMVQEEDQDKSSAIIQGISSEKFAKHPTWTENFLPVNEYSRSGETLPAVRDIFVHYTANPGTSAAQNRSYFEQQKDMHEASVSAHFIIGYNGEIIQCVPLDEIAYAVQTRNYDSISIECCYKASDGSFTQETYDSLISLLAWLTDTYDLDTSHILRHYDCGGKKCPLYYTEHEDAWAQLKADVAAAEVE